MQVCDSVSCSGSHRGSFQACIIFLSGFVTFKGSLMAYKKATRLVKFLRRRSLVWPADVPDLDVRVLELIGEFRNKDSLMLTKKFIKAWEGQTFK